MNKHVHQLGLKMLLSRGKLLPNCRCGSANIVKCQKVLKNLSYFFYYRCEGKIVLVFNHHNMDMYGEMKVKFHAFSSKEVGRGE